MKKEDMLKLKPGDKVWYIIENLDIGKRQAVQGTVQSVRTDSAGELEVDAICDNPSFECDGHYLKQDRVFLTELEAWEYEIKDARCDMDYAKEEKTRALEAFWEVANRVEYATQKRREIKSQRLFVQGTGLEQSLKSALNIISYSSYTMEDWLVYNESLLAAINQARDIVNGQIAMAHEQKDEGKPNE